MKAALVLVLCLGHLTLGANPNYSYHIKIDDAAHANYQEKAESRKGPDAQGFYSVVEPNGALRTVQYTADDRGFNPIVSYSYGHPGSSAAVYQSLGGAKSYAPMSYAPAFVSDKRVQIVDKLVGAPPQLNIQPFALPSPGGYPGPVVVPAPLRVAPAPQLIAQAQGVNYAPAYMPPVSAFIEPQRTYLPPPPQQVLYQSPPQQQVVYDAPQNFVAFSQPQVVYEAPRPQVAVAVPQQQQVIYQAPRPQVVAVPQQQVVYEAPRPQVVAVQQPQVVYEAPRPAIIAVQKQVVQPAPVKVVSQVVDSYAAPPRNTVTNPNAAVYPDAIKAVVTKPDAEYGVPNLVRGEPLSLETYAQAPPVIKVVQQKAVKVVQPVQVVQQQPIRYAQPVQYVQPAPVKYIQPQPQYIAPAPQVKVVQQQVAAPVLGLYSGAIGYHTHSTSADNYLHSYGTQGFQVTSSRKFNHGFISAPAVVQKQVVQPVAQVIQPQPQILQQAYAPQYYQPQPQIVAAPPPIRQFVAAAPPAPIAVQTYAPQYYQPQPVRQVVAAPVAVQQPVYGAPAAKLVQPVVGKKQNPLTFAYSYDQGGAKVSHSYSGSGW